MSRQYSRVSITNLVYPGLKARLRSVINLFFSLISILSRLLSLNGRFLFDISPHFLTSSIISLVISLFSIALLTFVLRKAHVLCVDTVSYTHLTLPTNREV
eukprot:TRINITY_DN10176_c0_g2_i1.p1 TRINITY_DN10176_c0_g2~~TRINITY_DN10176_c0_g2_i1.p1  ORF type:complete len:101 (+),score=3.68 TRINITY_DN10176_c0_g2_i1:31-333(+)